MATSQHQPREARRARGGSLLQRGARAIQDFNREQIDYWERFHQPSRTPVSHEGPLTWVLTLDGHRLAGCYLPILAERA